MEKLLVICGQTATGKTNLALYLAKVLASGPVGELVSADSRQIYKSMDIGTGKDLTKNAKSQKSDVISEGKRVCFYCIDGVRLWGYDLAEPTQDFSVGQYIKIINKLLKDIWSRNKLPILVGGTGLYIKGLVDGIPTSRIPRNRELRESLGGKSASELFELLTKKDPIKAASLNISDKKNPRRLIRALEIANGGRVVSLWFSSANGPVGSKDQGKKQKSASVLFVGLKAPRKVLSERIEKRVRKRVKQGLEKEIQGLLNSGVSWDDQAMNALGYKQWKEFFLGKKSKKEVIKNWMRDERNYAKRQMTWFKRDKRIKWFDISQENWQMHIEKVVKKWYKNM